MVQANNCTYFKRVFEDTDEVTGKTRKIAPFQPIYTAGYIQDKFAIEDLIFNVGLRIDRYDANQKVLKDKYLLYPAYTVDTDLSPNDVISQTNHPSNIGGDYVVYVDDVANPSVGYRNGDIGTIRGKQILTQHYCLKQLEDNCTLFRTYCCF